MTFQSYDKTKSRISFPQSQEKQEDTYLGDIFSGNICPDDNCQPPRTRSRKYQTLVSKVFLNFEFDTEDQVLYF